MNPSMVSWSRPRRRPAQDADRKADAATDGGACRKTWRRSKSTSRPGASFGSVQRLYEVGSPVPATLILLFSVIVPLGKAGLVAWAMLLGDAARRRTLRFVERSPSGRWPTSSSSRSSSPILPPRPARRRPASDAGPPLVAFTAHFGPGFYWFAAYCIFSLASSSSRPAWPVPASIADWSPNDRAPEPLTVARGVC